MGKKVFKSSEKSIMMGREIDEEKFQDCYLMHMYTYNMYFAKRIASHNPWHFQRKCCYFYPITDHENKVLRVQVPCPVSYVY